MNHTEIMSKLNEMAKELGSQRALAEKLGISTTYLSEVLRGIRGPGPAILKALGVEKETTYKEIT